MTLARAFLREVVVALRDDHALRKELGDLLGGPRRDDAESWVRIRDSGVAYSTLRAAIGRGEITARKVGRELRVRRGDLDRWIATRPGPRRAASRPVAGTADPEPDAEIARLLAEGRLRPVRGGKR